MSIFSHYLNILWERNCNAYRVLHCRDALDHVFMFFLKCFSICPLHHSAQAECTPPLTAGAQWKGAWSISQETLHVKVYTGSFPLGQVKLAPVLNTHLLPGTNLCLDWCHKGRDGLWPLEGSLVLARGQLVSTVLLWLVCSASNEAKVRPPSSPLVAVHWAKRVHRSHMPPLALHARRHLGDRGEQWAHPTATAGHSCPICAEAARAWYPLRKPPPPPDLCFLGRFLSRAAWQGRTCLMWKAAVSCVGTWSCCPCSA